MAMAKAEDLRRDVGFFGLLWISTGTDLGSGWLFGAFAAVTIAGPAVLIAWAIAAMIIILLALVYAAALAQATRGGALSVRGTRPR